MINNSNQCSSTYSYYNDDITSAEYNQQNMLTQPITNTVQQTQLDQNMKMVEYQESSKWCSVAYYEFNQRVGEMFHATSNIFCIDHHAYYVSQLDES